VKLVTGNKTYSSWSMRPWLALKVAGVPFEEDVIWLRQPDTKAQISRHSPNGKVPVLIDGDVVVFESIAILDYVAERAPALWPDEVAARAHARSVSAEMHAGFAALRGRCAFNIKREPRAIALDAEVQTDIDRIVQIWLDCRTRFGAGGDFLFGRFTNADAMFAPVVGRFHSYAVAVPAMARTYMEAMMALPAWQEWRRAALAEPQAIAAIDAIA
jgi:glutathione S-transferase